MVDTCPMTEGRARVLMSIDEMLTDSDFPGTIIDTLLEDMKPFEETRPENIQNAV